VVAVNRPQVLASVLYPGVHVSEQELKPGQQRFLVKAVSRQDDSPAIRICAGSFNDGLDALLVVLISRGDAILHSFEVQVPGYIEVDLFHVI
jgi:hypothetical protein